MLVAAPAARVVGPTTLNAHLWVEASRINALVSVRVTLLPLVTATVEKLLAPPNVMLFAAPVSRVVTPVTVRAPLWVRAPLVVTPKVPETVEAARFRALASVRATLFPVVMPTVLKSLPTLFNVMLLAAPAARVVAPTTLTAPLWVKAPLVVTPKVPETVEAPRINAFVSVRATLLPLVR